MREFYFLRGIMFRVLFDRFGARTGGLANEISSNKQFKEMTSYITPYHIYLA